MLRRRRVLKAEAALVSSGQALGSEPGLVARQAAMEPPVLTVAQDPAAAAVPLEQMGVHLRALGRIGTGAGGHRGLEGDLASLGMRGLVL